MCVSLARSNYVHNIGHPYISLPSSPSPLPGRRCRLPPHKTTLQTVGSGRCSLVLSITRPHITCSPGSSRHTIHSSHPLSGRHARSLGWSITMWTPCGRPSAAILTISRFLDGARIFQRRSDGQRQRDRWRDCKMSCYSKAIFITVTFCIIALLLQCVCSKY